MRYASHRWHTCCKSHANRACHFCKAPVLMVPLCLPCQSPQGAKLSGDIAVAFEQLWHAVFSEPLVTHAASKCDMYYCRCAANCRHLCGDMSHAERPLILLTPPWPPVTNAHHRVASAAFLLEFSTACTCTCSEEEKRDPTLVAPPVTKPYRIPHAAQAEIQQS